MLYCIIGAMAVIVVAIVIVIAKDGKNTETSQPAPKKKSAPQKKKQTPVIETEIKNAQQQNNTQSGERIHNLDEFDPKTGVGGNIGPAPESSDNTKR